MVRLEYRTNKVSNYVVSVTFLSSPVYVCASLGILQPSGRGGIGAARVRRRVHAGTSVHVGAALHF